MKFNPKDRSSAAPPARVRPASAEPLPDDSSELQFGSTRAGAPPAQGAPLPTEALFATTAPSNAPGGQPVAGVQPGTLIDRYMVLSRLGEGGMGVVFAAFDTKLERKIAIKLLHPQSLLDGAEGKARMLREAQVLAQLAHPNVVSIFDVGMHGGQVFIGMEFVDGGTLTDWGAQQPREPAAIRALFIQAGRGLSAAHAANFIHRDFKPDNVLIGQDGRARVTDFGVARLANQEVLPVRPDLQALSQQALKSGLHTPLTTADTLVGTPLYMAPEQFDGRPVDARSDQFSFCVALYQTLYSQRPFAGNTLADLYRNLLAGRVQPPPAGTRVPGWLGAIVLRGLSANPDARFANMDALLAALGRDPTAIWRRRGMAAAAAVLLLGLGSVAAQLAHRPHRDPCQSVRQQATARFAGLWDDRVKTTVHAALQHKDGSQSEAVWRKLSASLDEYTQQWVDMQHAACLETRRTPQPQRLALRTLCLELLHSQLTAVGPLLAKSTQQSVGNALAAVWSLPPVRSCEEGHTLDALLPLLAEPKERQAVQELTRQLAAVRVVEPGSEYKSLLAQARSIESRSRSGKYPPLQAESLLFLGALQQQAADRAGATSSLTQAAVDGLASGQLPVAAEAFARLVTLTALSKKFELADTYAQLAGATLTMLGKNDLSHARLLHAQGDLAAARQRFDEALQLHDQGLQFRQSLDHAHPDLAESQGKRGIVLRRLHRNREALQAFDQALAIYRSVFGDRHPRVALTMRWKSAVLADSGRFAEALATLNELRKTQESPAAQSPPISAAQKPEPDQELTLRELARVYLMMGEYRKAADFSAQALSKAVAGKEAGSAILRSRALVCLGALPDALAAAAQAQQSSRNLQGSQSLEFADATYWLASVVQQQGDWAKALQLHTEVLAIRDQQADPRDRASSLIAVGEALTHTKQAAQGLTYIEKALTLIASLNGPKPELSYQIRHVTAEAKAAKAAALWEVGRHRRTPEILALISEARSTYASAETPDPYLDAHLFRRFAKGK